MIDEMESCYTKIRDDRHKLADLNRQKIDIRAKAWEKAEGVAKQKEDYVRSSVSDIQNKIDKLEANIEYNYNQVKLIIYKWEISDE